MPYCAVKWCGKCSRTSSLQKDNITFHRFPKCPNLKSKWIDATKQDDNWFPSKSSVICSRHFATDCFQLMKKRRLLFDNAEPTLMLPTLGPSENESTTNKNIIIAVIPTTPLILTTAPPATTLQERAKNTDCTDNDLNIPMTLDMHISDTHNLNSIGLQQKDIRTISQQSTSTDILEATSITSPRKRRLRRSIIDLSLKLKSKNVIIKRLRDSNRILKKKVNSLKQLLEECNKNGQ